MVRSFRGIAHYQLALTLEPVASRASWQKMWSKAAHWVAARQQGREQQGWGPQVPLTELPSKVPSTMGHTSPQECRQVETRHSAHECLGST